jgi:hypothetical protein
MQFAAPSICLLAAEGFAAGIESLRSVRVRRVFLRAALASLVGFGVVPQAVSYLRPYRMVYDHESREFARRFWAEQAKDAQLACVDLDYGLGRTGTWLGRKSWYLCNQLIYSPQRSGRQCPAPHQISHRRPLRCVLFEEPLDSPRVQDWLGQMTSRFSLRGTRIYQAPATLIDGRSVTERWSVLDFVPLDSRPVEASAAVPASDRLTR